MGGTINLKIWCLRKGDFFMQVLITGGTGLVGSKVTGDIRLSSKDADLRDWNQTFAIFDKYKPETLDDVV